MAKNARILGIRLDDHTAQRLTRFENATLIEGVSLARASLCASLDSYELNGTLTLPLKIVPAQNEAKFTSSNANADTNTACASSAPSIATSPMSPSTPTTPANIVKLPPPPVVATLLHDIAAETQNPTLVPGKRKEVRYEKKRRKSAE